MKQNWTATNIPDLTGKIIIVTGANSGIGYQTALEFARKGAFVWLACRNETKANAAIQSILKEVPNAKVKFGPLDLSDLSTVKQFAELVKKESPQLDILVNNGGAMLLGPREETKDGFEATMGTNHLGHFALTALLIPLLKNSKLPRVVNVSSIIAKNGVINMDDFNFINSYSGFQSYANSKLANLLFTVELQKRADAAGWNNLVVTVAHPGAAYTNGSQAGGREGTWLGWFLDWMMYFTCQPDFKGAWPSEYAATAEVVPGGYYGPGSWFGTRGYPTFIDYPASAKDETLAEKVWELSEAKTGIVYRFK